MIPVSPPLRDDADVINVLEACESESYVTVPASIDAAGVLTIEYELTEDELTSLARGGRIRLSQTTYYNPAQPMHLEVIECDACAPVRES